MGFNLQDKSSCFVTRLFACLTTLLECIELSYIDADDTGHTQNSIYAAKGICAVVVGIGAAQYADAAGCGPGGK